MYLRFKPDLNKEWKERFPQIKVPLRAALDTIEEKIEDGYFICGKNYTMADSLFTCILARLSMVGILDAELKTRNEILYQ